MNRWTDDEKMLLGRLRGRLSTKELSEIFGRSEKSIGYQFYVMDEHPNIPTEEREHGDANYGACLVHVHSKILQDVYAMVDLEDFSLACRYSWSLDDSLYPNARVNGRVVRMNKLVIESQPGMVIDHMDRNGLNNQRENLRLISKAENIAMRRRKTVVGVYKDRDRWFARYRGKRLGTYQIFEHACLAYDVAAYADKGEAANLNYPVKRDAGGNEIPPTVPTLRHGA